MEVPYQYLLGCTEAGVSLNSERALMNEVVWPAKTSYESLIRQFLLLFMLNESLDSIQLTCILKNDYSEQDDEHLVSLTQHVKLTLTGSLSEPLEDKDLFVATHAPLHRMGTGTFTLRRSDPEVLSVLSDPASDKVAGHCLLLAQQALASFKSIRIERTAGQFLSS